MADLVVYLAGGGVLGGGAFLLTAYLLQVDEIRGLWRRAQAWCRARTQ